MAKIKVAVIFGGASSEHEVSLLSATSVIENIPTDKYEIIQIGITKKGRWLFYPGPVELIKNGKWETYADCVPAIISPDRTTKGIIKFDGKDFTTQKIDVVFPVLHGKNGEDGTIQGLFALSAIPYVGCNVISSAMCMDKAVTNTLLEYAGIAQADWDYATKTELEDFDAVEARVSAKLGYPIFVKPANAGSSVGVSKANNKEELNDSVNLALTSDRKVVFERAISGKEVECSVMGMYGEEPITSIPGEIVPSNEFYDYEAKYISGLSKEHIPARISDEDLAKVRETAAKAYTVMGCTGLARIDFFVENDTGKILLNELNTLPGFTSFSMYPKLMEATGIPYPELIDRLITMAFTRTEALYE
jgi:D-alanine--D-alanine ligase